MMKNINKFLFGIILTAGITACDPGDFGDVNINPNSPSNPIASSLLTGAERGIVSTITDTQGSLYVQQMANKQYTSADRYETVQWSYNGFYTGPLVNLQKIIDLNSDAATKGDAAQFGSNNNQIAIARILKAYFYMHMTDRWGDIPYSQALQGSTNFKPAFDAQSKIYPDLIKEVTEAAAQIDNGAAIKGDIINGGNMTKWKKFANSLKAIMALRMSKADPAAAKTAFTAAIAGGVITTNTDNIVYAFLAEDINDNPWQDRFESRKDWTVSEIFVNTLKSMNDPRLGVFADKALLKQDYVGMVYGLDESKAGSISNGDVSFLGEAMRQQTSPGYIVTAAQMHLAMAEAAVLGWTTDAEVHYNAAIKAGLEQYGKGADYATYIAGPNVKYNPAKAMEQIGTQRWITLFSYGYEAWAEWRRTGYPVLAAPANNLNPGGLIPRRQGYTTIERDLNAANYNAAVSALGGKDDLNGRVWWNK
jgi:hypothetical protein